MKITENEVQYVAGLSRLSLSSKEVTVYAGQLEQILEFIDTLNELDVTDVQPTSTILDIKNVQRADLKDKNLTTEEIMKNAPLREDDFFVVPQIIKG